MLAKCKNNKNSLDDRAELSKSMQRNKLLAEESFENHSEDGDVADILEETIEELNGIISSLKKISH